MGPTASDRGQEPALSLPKGGVAPGRAVPSGGLHRHQHVGWPRRGSAFLQRTRDCRAVDQRGQVRPELDTAVLPWVRGQPGAAGSVHPFDMLRTGLAYPPEAEGTSCAGYACPRRSSTGRCAVSRSSSSRSGHGWCATPGGWCSSSLKWLCLGMCSGPPVADWRVSARSMQYLDSEHPWGHRR